MQDHTDREWSQLTAGILREISMNHSLVDIWCAHHPDDTTTFTFVRVEEERAYHSQLD